MPAWGRGSTRASRAQRARVLTAWPTCHLQYPGCTIHSTEDDHVTPLAEGGTDHWDNHRGACHHCHNIKSRQEAARGRARARSTRTNQPDRSRRQPEQHPGRR